MRFFFFLTILFSFFHAGAQTPKSTDLILKEAFAKAGAENKNVFVIFHASWCVWCHRMDTAMNDASVKPFFDKSYVIEHLVVKESPQKKNLENTGAEELLIKFKGNEVGIPFWLVFNSKGELLEDALNNAGENTGCPATKEEVNYFIEVLKKTSKITPAEIVAVETRFRKNER